MSGDGRSASLPELKSVRGPLANYDVAILGGGLAGLTMAIQLERARPDTRVFVAEKRAGPAPSAAFKVGESSVEIGSHYYRNIIGVHDHLEAEHYRKIGLRFFLPAGDNTDIAQRVEIDISVPDVWTYQIDRGRFENELFDRAVAQGADVFRGCRVQEVELDPSGHRITVEHEGGTSTVTARWVVDASGRTNLLRRKLDIGRGTGHHINAAWLRLAGGFDLEEWSDDEEWLGRMEAPGLRRHSTTHMIGEGYWVWLIQLGTGPISVGVVADPRFHPFEEINELDKMLGWLRTHEPQVAAAIEGRRDDVQDFLVIEDFSYASTEVFSSDRWILTGEAGGFIDAFYSPGSDFIAYGNSFGSDLICRDLDGEDVEERLSFYDFFFFQLFDPTISLYKDQYQFFGNPQVMAAKQLYDNIAYFSTLAFLFIHDKMTQLEDLGDIVDVFETIIPLLGRMQDLYRDWHGLDQRQWQRAFVRSRNFEPMKRIQTDLGIDFDTATLVTKAKENVEVMKAIAVWTFHMAAKSLPDTPDPATPINPLAVSLRPDRWEEEGLFSADGMTLAAALELLPGIAEFDLEAQGAVLPDRSLSR